ncbi:MAG: hypothetical protein ACJ76L_03385 [Conexibacter sp.]
MRLVPVLAAAMLIASFAAPAAQADEVLLPDCGNLAYGGSVMPVEWSSGCVGASFNVQDLVWSGWGAATTTAAGTRAYNDCDPSCADGDIRLYPVHLTADRIRRCASLLGARWYYTHVTLVTTFPAGNPDDFAPGPSEPTSFTIACSRPSWTVGLGKRHARLGPFVDGGEYDADRIELLFGRPSTTRASDGFRCTKRWPKLGMTAEFVVFGTDADPCQAGMFSRATLTGSRWHTSEGVRVGGSARKAARRSRRTCTRDRCGVAGYGYALHRSECAGGTFPAVIAQTARGRVRRLIVFARWCE